MATQSGMSLYGSKSRSLATKTLMTLCHAVALALVGWLLFGGGIAAISDRFAWSAPSASTTRRALLLACASIYFVRLATMAFVMVKRTMKRQEAGTIGLWIIVIHVTMAWFGGRDTASVGVLTWLGVALYLVGAAINTGSEAQRMVWKKRPENKGKLYTEGMFAWSMHVNYFGDVLHFLGWAIVAGATWPLLIPAVILCMFVFVNIPMLDSYLAQRYGEQFTRYSRTTKKLVPGIY